MSTLNDDTDLSEDIIVSNSSTSGPSPPYLFTAQPEVIFCWTIVALVALMTSLVVAFVCASAALPTAKNDDFCRQSKTGSRNNDVIDGRQDGVADGSSDFTATDGQWPYDLQQTCRAAEPSLSSEILDAGHLANNHRNTTGLANSKLFRLLILSYYYYLICVIYKVLNIKKINCRSSV